MLILVALLGCGFSRGVDVEEPVEPPLKDATSRLINESETAAHETTPFQNRYYHYLAAQKHITRGDLDRAILDLQKVIELDPDSAYLRRELAIYYLQLQNSSAAIDVLDTLITNHPEDPESQFLYARALESLDRKAEAIAAYEKLIDSDSEQEMAFLRLGDLYLEKNDLDNAYRIYSKLLENFPYSYAGHFFVGKIHSIRKEYDLAEEHILRTLELVPGLEEPRYEIADIYKAKGEQQKAIDVYKEILEQNSKNLFAALELAVLYQENGSMADATALLKKVGAESYNDPGLYRIIGQEYLEQNRFQPAAMLLTGMLESAPETSGLSYLLGIALVGNGEKETAIERFKQVDGASRFFVRSAIQISLLYQETGKTDSAIEYLKQVIKDHPDNPDLYFYLGMFYEEIDSLDNASQSLQEGLRLSPENIQLNFRLGVVFDKLKERDKSIQQMKTVIHLDNKHVNALNYLGYTYADMGIKLDEAEKLILTALENKPDDGYITDSLGWVYYKKGQFEKAMNYLEKAVQLVPDDPTILEHLGDVYLKLQQSQKALDFYRRALSLKKDDKADIESKIKSLLENGHQPE